MKSIPHQTISKSHSDGTPYSENVNLSSLQPTDAPDIGCSNFTSISVKLACEAWLEKRGLRTKSWGKKSNDSLFLK